MIKSRRVSDIKKERRKSFFFRELTALIQELAGKEEVVADLYVSNVEISPNSGICYVYFSSFKEPGEEIYNNAFGILKLYKSSLRKAFAERIQVRHTPDLVFLYDKAKEKERRITELLDKVHEELPPEDKDKE